jgi:hypothetical protein
MDDPGDTFSGLYEPFAGLNEFDYELHGIYFDYEPEHEFVSSLDKVSDIFLNVLVTDENLRNSTLGDETHNQMYHPAEFQSDEDEPDAEADVTESTVKKKFRIHDPTVRWDKMDPKLGDLFESPSQLKICLTNYAVANGYAIYFEKCDSQRIVARCGKKKEPGKCPFRLYASWMFNEHSFQIKSFNSTHNCSRVFKFGSIVSPEWIGRQYISEIRNKPKMKLRDMITDIRQKYRCEVNIGKVRRAKDWVKELIEGKLKDHYARIWDYSHELLRSNPGSTCQVTVTSNPDGNNYFHRIYICFKAVSDCWKKGCRRVIGLDGCFLKGRVKGELLTAIGRDANNQVFPIAWAVVDVENKPNWTWFINLLRDDLDLDAGKGLVIISDQHKVRHVLCH